jgi:hypothetical protein
MPREQANFNHFIHDNDSDYIIAWLYTSISNNILLPFTSTDEPHIALQLSYLFKDLATERKEKFKNCVRLSINEWSLSYNNSLHLLKQLVLLASYVRCTRSFNAIRVIIVNDILDFLPDDEYRKTIGLFLNTIRGFGPDEEINDFFYNVFYDDSFHYTFVPHAFLALCEYKPSSFVDYLPRYFQYLEKYEKEYKSELIFLEFVRVIKLPLIAKYINRLDKYTQSILLQSLCFEPNSPASFYPDYNGYYFVYRDWFLESIPNERVIIDIFKDEDLFHQFMEYRLYLLKRTNGSLNSVKKKLKEYYASTQT